MEKQISTEKNVEMPAMCRMTNSEINKLIENHVCPECGSKLQNGGNCYVCVSCGWSRC